jgi:hypothetical protein
MLIFYNEQAFKPNASFHGIQKVLPFPHAPLFDLAPDRAARLILYRRPDGLELWRLGSAVDADSSQAVVPVNVPPVKLLDMELNKVPPLLIVPPSLSLLFPAPAFIHVPC